MGRRVAIGVLLALLVGAGGVVAENGTPASASHTWKGTFTKHTLAATPSYPLRDYYLYTPPAPRPAGQRPLVVVLHGCTQTALQAALGVMWNDLADREGFLVVYPEQSTAFDGSAGRCWNSGQAAVFPRGQGELESIAEITRRVTAAHGVQRDRVHLIGLSAGANMTNVMAATYPDLYRSIAVVAGCGGYLCGDATGHLAHQRMGARARVVPAMIVMGTADEVQPATGGHLNVSQWVGTNDLADNGATDGSVSRTPSSIDHYQQQAGGSNDTCIRNWNNPCPAGVFRWASYPYTVTRHDDADDVTVVEGWTIHGLSHNYPGGSAEGTFVDTHGPDVTGAAWRFFAGTVAATSVAESTFPSTAVGSRSPVRSISLASTGREPLRVEAAVAPSGFVVERDGCSGAVLRRGEICSVDVSFAPHVGGPATGALRFVTNAVTGRDSVALSGLGDAAPTVQILDRPADLTRDRLASIGFTVDDDVTPPAALVVTCSVDGAAPVACASPFGTGDVGDGRHVFEVSATDEIGNVTAVSFTWVVDATAPVITTPPVVEADATSPAGAVVGYETAGVDAISGPVPVACFPAAGGTFAIGTTIVSCTASDAAGNIGIAEFAVRVRGATEQLQALRASIKALAADRGTVQSLLSKVDEALAALAVDADPCESLRALANRVDSADGTKLTTADAAAIRTSTARISVVIGC